MKKALKIRGRRFIVCLFVLAMVVQLVPTPGQPRGASAAALEMADILAAAANSAAGPSAAKSDIDGHWAEAAIRADLQEGVVSGFPDGSFHPNDQVVRAQFAAMINRAFRDTQEAAGGASPSNPVQAPSGKAAVFADVTAAKWYAADVAKAQAAGYMQGDGSGLFHPEASITREEAAVVIARLMKLDTSSEDKAGRFADAQDMASWSRRIIYLTHMFTVN
ncbi:S-layer homology domain-containing protein [Cohnella cellulosilytica]|uniref:S-layer homology domain-containing protein n=1 Tax=Cohnella cellulosilytica TaxID=986710 RepID=A0ABW2FD50_9BACL